jgi:copper homeostasis protein
VNVEQLRRIRRESADMTLTFHRAIDVSRSYMDALEDVIACKCNRLLTSGQQSSALKGTVLVVPSD